MGHGGVQAVDDVQVMGPGFGPVFPGVGAGVGADKSLGPVGRRTLLVVLLQRLGIVCAFIPEQGAERFEPLAIPDQPIPVIVPDLVAEVADQGAVGLVHGRANLLAPGVIGFFRVKGNQAAGVAGHYPLAFLGGVQDIEGQAVLRVLLFRLNREAQVQ